MQLFAMLTFHISRSCSSTADPGNIGRPQTISKKIHPTPLQEEECDIMAHIQAVTLCMHFSPHVNVI